MKVKVRLAYDCHSIPACLALIVDFPCDRLSNIPSCQHFDAPVYNMDDAWRNFQANMKDKRASKKKRSSTNTILEKEDVVMQQLSLEVSGRAQKYTRVGRTQALQQW